MQSAVSLGLPDELHIGALEGNRLAAGIVGTLVFPVRRGVPTVALLYERQRQDVALRIPLADLVPLVIPTATPLPGTRLRSRTARPPGAAPAAASAPGLAGTATAPWPGKCGPR